MEFKTVPRTIADTLDLKRNLFILLQEKRG